MAITRTPIINDDGTCTTGTVIDNAWKTEFYNQIDAALVMPTNPSRGELYVDMTADFYNNWQPPNGANCETWALGTTIPGIYITGILAEGVGVAHYLTNLNTNPVTIYHMNGGSSGPNQIYCPGGVDYSLLGGRTVRIYRSSLLGVWVLQVS